MTDKLAAAEARAEDAEKRRELFEKMLGCEQATSERLRRRTEELGTAILDKQRELTEARRQRDELLDAILAQAQRSLMSIPHDIWAAAVRINKAITPDPVNPVHSVEKEPRP